ncbi:hypothetical protein M758_5G091700 [Ceratodon purpureus]|nr:hypothetical protein M758_5G091700 [Ceratodon purpureus]
MTSNSSYGTFSGVHRRSSSEGGQFVLQMEDMNASAPQPSRPQQQREHDDLEVSSRRGLGLDAWCLPPIPVINEAAARFAESASNLGRQIAKVVEETVAPLPPSPSFSNGSNGLNNDSERFLLDFIDSPNVAATSPRVAADAVTESNSILSNLGVEQAQAIFASTSKSMMAMGQQILSGPPAAWHGLVTRVQTTLRGSADDIGWLQKMPNALPVEDDTAGFLRALEIISHGVHILPNSVTYLLIPGLFSNHGPLYFVDTKKYFLKLGLSCHIAKIHSEAAVEKNATEIKEHILELYWGSQKKIVLLGHSKGGVDAAAACSMYWDELKDKVVGLALIQSPYGGSPVAADILREGQIADFETRRIMEMLVSKVLKGDLQALLDLTYEKRREFLAKYTYPSDLPTICFHTEASRAPGWVATMSHIAHADVVANMKLPVAFPLAAAMAICALHLEIRYGEKSDGLVTRKDAEVPGSIVVRPEKKLDHGWMVYSPVSRDPLEPDAAQMCEALVTLLLNHDKWKRPQTPVTPQAEAVVSDAQQHAETVVPPS